MPLSREMQAQILIGIKADGEGELDRARQALAAVKAEVATLETAFASGVAGPEEFRKGIGRLDTELKFFSGLVAECEASLLGLDMASLAAGKAHQRLADDMGRASERINAFLKREADEAEAASLREMEALARWAARHETLMAKMEADEVASALARMRAQDQAASAVAAASARVEGFFQREAQAAERAAEMEIAAQTKEAAELARLEAQHERFTAQAEAQAQREADAVVAARLKEAEADARWVEQHETMLAKEVADAEAATRKQVDDHQRAAQKRADDIERSSQRIAEFLRKETIEAEIRATRTGNLTASEVQRDNEAAMRREKQLEHLTQLHLDLVTKDINATHDERQARLSAADALDEERAGTTLLNQLIRDRLVLQAQVDRESTIANANVGRMTQAVDKAKLSTGQFNNVVQNIGYGLGDLAQTSGDFGMKLMAVTNNVQFAAAGFGLAGVAVGVGVTAIASAIRNKDGILDMLGMVSDQTHTTTDDLDFLNETVKKIGAKSTKLAIDYRDVDEAKAKIKELNEARAALEKIRDLKGHYEKESGQAIEGMFAEQPEGSEKVVEALERKARAQMEATDPRLAEERKKAADQQASAKFFEARAASAGTPEQYEGAKAAAGAARAQATEAERAIGVLKEASDRRASGFVAEILKQATSGGGPKQADAQKKLAAMLKDVGKVGLGEGVEAAGPVQQQENDRVEQEFDDALDKMKEGVQKWNLRDKKRRAEDDARTKELLASDKGGAIQSRAQAMLETLREAGGETKEGEAFRPMTAEEQFLRVQELVKGWLAEEFKKEGLDKAGGFTQAEEVARAAHISQGATTITTQAKAALAKDEKAGETKADKRARELASGKGPIEAKLIDPILKRIEAEQSREAIESGLKGQVSEALGGGADADKAAEILLGHVLEKAFGMVGAKAELAPKDAAREVLDERMAAVAAKSLALGKRMTLMEEAMARKEIAGRMQEDYGLSDAQAEHIAPRVAALIARGFEPVEAGEAAMRGMAGANQRAAGVKKPAKPRATKQVKAPGFKSVPIEDDPDYALPIDDYREDEGAVNPIRMAPRGDAEMHAARMEQIDRHNEWWQQEMARVPAPAPGPGKPKRVTAAEFEAQRIARRGEAPEGIAATRDRQDSAPEESPPSIKPRPIILAKSTRERKAPAGPFTPGKIARGIAAAEARKAEQVRRQDQAIADQRRKEAEHAGANAKEFEAHKAIQEGRDAERHARLRPEFERIVNLQKSKDAARNAEMREQLGLPADADQPRDTIPGWARAQRQGKPIIPNGLMAAAPPIDYASRQAANEARANAFRSRQPAAPQAGAAPNLAPVVKTQGDMIQAVKATQATQAGIVQEQAQMQAELRKVMNMAQQLNSKIAANGRKQQSFKPSLLPTLP